MKLIVTSLALLLALPAATAAVPSHATNAAVQVTPEYLEVLAEEMRTNHPALKAGYARSNAAVAAIDAIRTWEDPTLLLGAMGARREMRADEGDIIYGLEQK